MWCNGEIFYGVRDAQAIVSLYSWLSDSFHMPTHHLRKEEKHSFLTLFETLIQGVPGGAIRPILSGAIGPIRDTWKIVFQRVQESQYKNAWTHELVVLYLEPTNVQP